MKAVKEIAQTAPSLEVAEIEEVIWAGDEEEAPLSIQMDDDEDLARRMEQHTMASPEMQEDKAEEEASKTDVSNQIAVLCAQIAEDHEGNEKRRRDALKEVEDFATQNPAVEITSGDGLLVANSVTGPEKNKNKHA